MRAPLFHVDAFTTTRFAGNPAAVVVLEAYPDDRVLHAIAAENNLSETAFLVSEADAWHLRWFTPLVEVPLCGHATLASGWTVLERLRPKRDEVTFLTRKSGALHVRRDGAGYAMDFPSQPTAPSAGARAAITRALGVTPREVRANAGNYLAVLDSAATVRALSPVFAEIMALDRSGLIVTAAGDDGYDCVSRYFAPQKGIPEDPVTGGAHCALTPYWAARLGKPSLKAYQASPRGGVVACRQDGERVELAGTCVPYLEGHIEL